MGWSCATPMLLAWALAAPMNGQSPLGVDDCVRIALAGSAKIDQAAARVRQLEARLAEVESVYYPKLSALTFLAPMYTVEGDIFHVERRWQHISDWGPYTHLQALLALPLYTFGRAEAGEAAARERTEVERARLRETENTVALEVKKLYYARLFALSMLPSLRSAKKTAAEALQKAQDLYDEGGGEVTQVDLQKLHYANSEVQKYLLLAQNGASLAEAALKHTMGMAHDEALTFAQGKLEAPADTPLPPLADLFAAAAQKRPEWAQLSHGKAATLKLEDAERLANYPVLFLAGSFSADWAPTRDDARNPYRYDAYNGITGGIALGLKLDLDPALAAAKAKGARALGDEVEALARFASSGIPLQVYKAHTEVEQANKLVELAQEGVVATRKWLTFAAAGYTTGVGEARDLLEGLVAYLQARKSYYENLNNYYVARAELDFAVGSR